MTPAVLVLGPRTPPFHGAAIVNDAMVEAFSARSCQVRPIDTAGRGSRGRYHLTRLAAHLRAAAELLRRRRSYRAGGLYVTGAGGAGLWYQAAVAGWARLLGVRVMVHHHSYAYLHRRSPAMRWLWSVTRRGVHVVLCDDMGRRLVDGYGAGPTLVTCSNAAFVPVRDEPHDGTVRPEVLRVGHLANLSADKGLDDVVRAFRAVAATDPHVVLELAGPAADAAATGVLDELLAGPLADRVRWTGPLDRDEVWTFLRGIDVFVFPSRYRNEAEPLVVLEALACGVPAVVTGVGCLAGTLRGWPWAVAEGAGLDAALAAVVAAARRPDGTVDRAGLRVRAAEQRGRFGVSGLESLFESWEL